MAITALGWVFIPALVLCLWRARVVFPVLLIGSAVFQAAAVISLPLGERNVGISPYHVCAGMAAVLLIRDIFLTRTLPRPEPRLIGVTLLLALYVVVAAISALLMPLLMAGTPVHLHESIWTLNRPEPLVLTRFNISQALGILVHFVVWMYLCNACRLDTSLRHRLMRGFMWTAVMAALIGMNERLATHGLSMSTTALWNSNPGYAQIGVAGDFNPVRIGTPFSEPSYASAFLAAAAMGMLAHLIVTRTLVALLFFIVTSAGLLNSLGTTGLVTAIIGMPLMFCVIIMHQLWHRRRLPSSFPLHRWRTLAIAVTAIAVLIAAFPWKEQAHQVMSGTITQKLQREFSPESFRMQTNLHAIEVFWGTYSLGSGLGSNRTSSFFLGMASNVGLPGTLVFMAMLGISAIRYWRTAPLSSSHGFAITSLLGATLAVGLAIPDLNVPFYWAFLFLALLWIPERPRDATHA